MLTRFIRSVALCAVLFVLSSTTSIASEPSKEETAILSRLLMALQKADYAAFVADGDVRVKQLPKEQFEAFAGKVASKLEGGYEITYFGDLKQKGSRITIWRLRFKNSDDDALASLSMKDGKVGGFYVL